MPLRFPLFWAPLIVFGYIFIEIAAFIFVGGKIGIVPTLLLVFASSLAGIRLLQTMLQGFSAQIKAAIRHNRLADTAVIRRLIGCLGAVLLIAPGFISSLCGLVMLVPAVRDYLLAYIRRRGSSAYRASFTFRARPAAEDKEERRPRQPGKLIDLEPENYHARDPENSPWRRR